MTFLPYLALILYLHLDGVIGISIFTISRQYITQYLVFGSIFQHTTLFLEGEKTSEYCSCRFCQQRNQTRATSTARECAIQYTIASRQNGWHLQSVNLFSGPTQHFSFLFWLYIIVSIFSFIWYQILIKRLDKKFLVKIFFYPNLWPSRRPSPSYFGA